MIEVTDRFWSHFQDLGNGMYTAVLRITGFKEEDANQRYLLVVENEFGETDYKVKLSMDDAPKGNENVLCYDGYSCGLLSEKGRYVLLYSQVIQDE